MCRILPGFRVQQYFFVYFSILTYCETSLLWLPEGCSGAFSAAVSSLGISGIVFEKEEQLSAIRQFMKGGRNVSVCLIWEEPLLPNYAVCYGTRTWWR